MNPYESPYTPPTEAPAPKRRRWVTPLVGIAGLAVGAALAGGAAGTATADPEVITETVTEVETVTETVEVEVVPGSCLVAIDEARAGFTIAADVMRVIGPATEAAFYHDVAGMEAAAGEIESLSVELNGLNFVGSAAACEGAAR